MVEEQKQGDTQEKPVETKPVEKPVEPQDLVSRASQMKIEPSDGQEPKFDRNAHDEMISKLPPEQQEQVKAYENSLMSGANKKFEEAANIRKQAESERSQPWNTERVRNLLNDQSFVQSANEVTKAQALSQNPQDSGMSNDEWSSLTEQERSQFHMLRQNQVSLQNQMSTLMARQEDTHLTDRYKNYDAGTVNKIQSDLLNGNLQATREHLWKVADYESAVKRAYELGKQDRQIDIQERQGASSMSSGVTTSEAKDTPTKQPNESVPSFFKRLALHNMEQLAKNNGRK